MRDQVHHGEHNQDANARQYHSGHRQGARCKCYYDTSSSADSYEHNNNLCPEA